MFPEAVGPIHGWLHAKLGNDSYFEIVTLRGHFRGVSEELPIASTLIDEIVLVVGVLEDGLEVE